MTTSEKVTLRHHHTVSIAFGYGVLSTHELTDVSTRPEPSHFRTARERPRCRRGPRRIASGDAWLEQTSAAWMSPTISPIPVALPTRHAPSHVRARRRSPRSRRSAGEQ